MRWPVASKGASDMNRIQLSALGGSAAAAALLIFTGPAMAQAQEQTYQFDVPAQDLGGALRAFGQASHQQIIFSEDAVRGKRSPALVGSFTVSQGLQRLLATSGLSVRRTQAGVITVGTVATLADDPAPAAASTAKEVAELTVTGSRIRRSDPSSVTPIQAVTTEDLSERGYFEVGQMLNDLSSNQPTFAVPPSNGFPVVTAGHESPNLFGLGSGRTLTLVNGRRMVTTGSGLFDRAVDSNIVPVGLLDRVDIVEGGGSAVYGSEAIAGVVNYILKSHFTGVELEAQYGISSRGDDRRPNLRGTFGQDFDGGRGNFAVNVDWSKTESLAYGDRPWTVSGLTTIPNAANTSTSDGRPPTVYLPNGHIWTYNNNGVIFMPFAGFSPTTAALLRNGGGSALQFASDGASIIPYDTGVTNGTKAMGGQGQAYNDLSSLTAGLERTSVYGVGHYDLTPHLKVSTELLYSHETTDDAKGTQGVAYFAGGGFGPISFDRTNPFLTASELATLSAANPAFAAGSPLLLSKTLQILPNRDRIEIQDTWRGVLALDGDFEGWGDRKFYYSASYSLAGSATEDKLHDQYVDHLTNALSAVKNGAGQTVCAINAVTVKDAACVPINPFAGFAQQDPKALAYATLVSGSNNYNIQEDFLLTFGGDIVHLPGGELRFSAAYEHRYESARFKPFLVDQLGFSSSPATGEAGHYATNEYSAELLVPIVGDKFTLPFVEKLEATGSFRRVDNSLAGSENVWAVGGRWVVGYGLGFRASRSRNFRAPTLDAQFAPTSSFITTPGADPCDASNINGGPNPSVRLANCQALFAAHPGYGSLATFHDAFTSVSATRVTTGGNPDLQNEISKSFTWGLVFQPDYIPGLLFSADRTEVTIDNAFTDVNPQTATALCYDTNDPQACGSFTRNAAGFIDTAHDQTQNAGYVVYQGEIYTASYRFPISRFAGESHDWGTLELDVDATHITRFGGKATALSKEVDSQGVFSSSFFSGIFYEPKWRSRWDVRWTQGPFKVFYSLNYLPSVKSSPTATIENAAVPHIAGNITHDLSAQYSWDKFIATAGVDNLTDKGPSFPTITYGDPYGRRFFVSLRAKF
jgi:iron complex outermembrane receptor protein